MCHKLRYPNPHVAKWAAEYIEKDIGIVEPFNIYACNEEGCDSKFWHITRRYFPPSNQRYWARRIQEWDQKVGSCYN